MFDRLRNTWPLAKKSTVQDLQLRLLSSDAENDDLLTQYALLSREFEEQSESLEAMTQARLNADRNFTRAKDEQRRLRESNSGMYMRIGDLCRQAGDLHAKVEDLEERNRDHGSTISDLSRQCREYIEEADVQRQLAANYKSLAAERERDIARLNMKIAEYEEAIATHNASVEEHF